MLLKVSWTSEPCIKLFSQVCMYCCFISYMALSMWSQGVIIVHLSHSYRLVHVIHWLFIIAGEISCTKGCLVQFSNKINRFVLTKNIFKIRQCSTYNLFWFRVCLPLGIVVVLPKLHNWLLSTNSPCIYMAEILPIRRKTLSSQSINPLKNFNSFRQRMLCPIYLS